MNIYLNNILFVYYPYVAVAVFLLGSFLRLKHLPYGWRAGSTQIMEKKGLKFFIGSNFFHIGIIVILAGHFVGLLTPHAFYSPFIMARAKEVMAMTVGGIAGIICLIGLLILIQRRMLNPRLIANTSFGDMAILFLLLVQLLLGLATIPVSMHDDASATSMVSLSNWLQHLVIFSSDTGSYIINENWIYKAHVLVGFTIFLVFPFSRLVHIWSVPVGYVTRKGHQIMRKNI